MGIRVKAALSVLRPGQNVDVRLVDFDGDLDELLRPYFDGADFEHLYVMRSGGVFDMFIARADVAGDQLVNEEATRLWRRTLPDDARVSWITGTAVLIEAINWE
jgi:hypothetical protein